jgi:acetylornithine deacetylase/succinyl-diaminopimelate desuccinylase-like protein
MRPLKRVMAGVVASVLAAAAAAVVFSTVTVGQAAQPDWARLQDETMAHYQALLRFDTSDPPGREEPAATYLREVFEKEGIPVQTFSLEPQRPNIVARLKGNGRKRPLLIMGHTDVVNVDPAKWSHPPFSATRDGGYVYGRGTIDDKDNVTAALMTMLLLKRLNVPLDRDVIFLAEAGEEGTTRVGIQYIANEHYAGIDAEYCLAEGGGVNRVNGQVKYATVQTIEKIPRAIEITARGTSGHGSIPLKDNPIVQLAAAVAAVGRWRPPVRLNETTGAYFKRLAELSTPEEAARYRALLSLDPKVVAAADDWMFEHEPRHSSMLRSSASPNIFTAGYRVNVIPSEAKATIDVRVLPDEDPAKFLDAVRAVVDDPTLDVHWAQRDVRPGADTGSLSSEGFKAVEAAIGRIYKTVTLPTMSTGATDMAYLRAKGMQCYGIGPATDVEDGPKGFGSHSDQERLLESELHRFVQFNWDVVTALAASGPAR